MRHLSFLGLGLAVLGATCSGQDAKPRLKHFHEKPESTKSAVVVKAPVSASPQANLRRMEQQATKMSAPQRAKRAPVRASVLKTEKEKSTPPINFNGSSKGAKGPGAINQGRNPYKGRLRQKGSGH